MLKKILTGLSIALLVLAGSAVLFFNWSATGWKALAVPTTSMHPAIPQNSLVLTHRVPINSLKVGDVITYVNPFNPKETISHRIIKTYLISGKIPGFVTKGDANKVADVPIAEGSVVGKVVGHVPHAGAWLLWTKKPVALLPLIYIPALLLMIEEVQRLTEYYRLSEPYRLPGFLRQKKTANHHPKLAAAGALSTVFVLSGIVFWQPALALLRSNTVALVNNNLSVAATSPPTCNNTNTHNNTSVTVTNSSSQTATSGSATSSNSSSGGSATSGNASNNNSTNTNITITNGC